MDAAPGILKRIFLNPLAVREVRQACRSWKLVVFLSVYLLLQGAIFAIWVYNASDRGTFTNPTSTGRGLFITMSIVLVTVVMLIFPAFSSTAIASEHEKKSFDLLLLTPLSPWEIALGKFFAAAIQASVFLIATVPLFAMANLFGGIEPEVFFVTIWVLVLLSVLISFVGVYASSLVTRAIPAVLVTYAFAFVLGLILLVVFLTLAFAAVASTAFPLVGFFANPTIGEGIFYVVFLTVSCALYCSLLFLSTTNRLKPTSHNKSTNMRLFWTLAAVVVPAQVASYFLVARLPDVNMTLGALVTAGVYLTLLLAVPALSFPAEPPLPSRRVRREMDKASPSMLKAGGALFFPGSLRGVLHISLVSLLGFALLLLAAYFCFDSLQARAAADRSQLAIDYMAATGRETAPAGMGPLMALLAPMTLPTGITEAEMRDGLSTYYGWSFKGFVLFLGALLAGLLVVVQVTWRISLSGLSRGISSVLGGLVLVVWIAVPYMAQGIIGNESETENMQMAQISPVHGAITGSQWGSLRGRSDLNPGPEGSRYRQRADAAITRWSTFMGLAALMGAGLLISNVMTYRRVMRAFEQAVAQQAAPAPVAVSQQQIDQAIAALSQPQAPPAEPPALSAPPVSQPGTAPPGS